MMDSTCNREILQKEDKCTVIASRERAQKGKSPGFNYKTYRLANGFEAGSGGVEMDLFNEIVCDTLWFQRLRGEWILTKRVVPPSNIGQGLKKNEQIRA